MGSKKSKVSAKNIRLQQRNKGKSASEDVAEQTASASEQAPQRPRGVPVKHGDLLLPFEKLVLFLLILFLLAVPFAFLDRFEPMIYVGIIDLLLLGIVFAFKPQFVMQVMRKKNIEKFEKNYGKRVKLLSIALRLYGVGFFVIGFAMLRILILK